MPPQRATPNPSRPASSHDGAYPQPRAARGAFLSIPSQVLEAAARRVVTQWREEVGDLPDHRDVTEMMSLVATAVHQRQTDPDAPVDERTRSTLGRGLLERLRAELVRGWPTSGVPDSEMPPLLLAMERVHDAIEPGWGRAFADELAGGDGADLLVEVVHDLRSPLTSILFLAETLQRGQSGAVNDVQHRQLGLIYTAALGLSTVASDLIELNRGGEQLVEQEAVPFSVTAVLESVRDIVKPMAEEKKLAVRLLPPARDERLGHPVALSRVLLNLTTNALKFTDQGYVELVTQEMGTSRVEFAVRDSGKGIDPAIVRTLYQPLRKAPGRSSGQLFSQTGLGLTICRKLAAAMGSELRVETRPGWGTRFIFDLELPPCPSTQPRAIGLGTTRGRGRGPRHRPGGGFA